MPRHQICYDGSTNLRLEALDFARVAIGFNLAEKDDSSKQENPLTSYASLNIGLHDCTRRRDL